MCFLVKKDLISIGQSNDEKIFNPTFKVVTLKAFFIIKNFHRTISVEYTDVRMNNIIKIACWRPAR